VLRCHINSLSCFVHSGARKVLEAFSFIRDLLLRLEKFTSAVDLDQGPQR